ncbi:MAG TPA: malto-oligosyltrehalose synthase, partial [Aeromicrobium sp.]|nr:malto-oligosyltrehalose synthase [Aeromicrobium sp.]
MPRATYRVQLQPAFGFEAAAGIADYLHRLGVSHFYSSPYLQAAPGSTHGYDVVDPRRVNDELGGPVAHQRFCATLGENDLGQILDIVPNHMAIGGPENPWWWDVLENGPSSRYARFFDVEWDSANPEFRATVLLPVLGDHYGRVLEANELTVSREKATFLVCYADRVFPVAPPALESLLVDAGRSGASEELVFIGESLGRLPASTATDRESMHRRHRGKEVLLQQLRRLLHDHVELATAVDDGVRRLNADVDRLDVFLGWQNYRLAFWRAARDDLDYRRFFDVTTLAGLRMEDEHVFNETHELVGQWLRDGLIDGVRVDHPDGLRDPRQYFERLRNLSPDGWVVAEKILEREEELPTDWPVAGTTGYDFMNHVTRLFIDPVGEEPLTRLYAEFTGEDADFADVVYAEKQRILRDVLASEFNRLAEYLVAVVRSDRRNRDFTRGQVRDALREAVACFPVYRTYIRAEAGDVSPTDREHVAQALAEAARRRPDLPPDLLECLADVLLLRVRGANGAEFVMRFQQLTAPVTAKGVEDTAFYNYNRLVALNEVGGDPGMFAESLDGFHATQVANQKRWPAQMLGSSTHDTKRAEDVRIRIGLLSEIPQRWAETVTRWRAMNDDKRRGDWPDRNTEYLIYQTLVGAWPIARERLIAYVEKATREAKRHTSWTDTNEEYERQLGLFVAGVLADKPFAAELEQLVSDITPAWHATALAQTLLKLTAPGVPDTYQGTEIWDLSLVD